MKLTRSQPQIFTYGYWPSTSKYIIASPNMQTINGSADLAWPSSTIISLTILLVTVVLAPVGWIVQKHWGHQASRVPQPDGGVEIGSGDMNHEAEGR
ncbi:hypothetical protein PG989_004235 [Apiospora arundinis]